MMHINEDFIFYCASGMVTRQVVMVQPCYGTRCKLCPQIRPGNQFQFNCGFIFRVKENNLNCNSKDVIYVLKCTTCGAEYIGETENVRRRMNVHLSSIRTRTLSCRAAEHLVECGTNYSDIHARFSIFLLEVEKDKFKRKAKESFYIHLFLPKMNK